MIKFFIIGYFCLCLYGLYQSMQKDKLEQENKELKNKLMETR